MVLKSKENMFSKNDQEIAKEFTKIKHKHTVQCGDYVNLHHDFVYFVVNGEFSAV